MSSLKRITKELNDIKTKASVGHDAFPIDTLDMYKWKAAIEGPESTPYSGGIFYLEIKFPLNYPFNPPQVKFTTKIFHPNVNKLGNISIDILDCDWSPSKTIITGEKLDYYSFGSYLHAHS